MAGTHTAVRDHTMSTVSWHRMWVNGKPMGEIGLWATIAGHYGVPCVLVSGCEKACAEAAELVPGIETVATKKGLSRYSAVLESAEKVRAMIRERAEAAIGKAKTIAPYRVETPVEVRVEYNNSGYADQVRIVPGRERLDARTIAYRGDTALAAFRML
jgi:D-amino peptidase